MPDCTPNVRAIAHYLPQFHPIPENDEWWGKGFTEWTHVARAKPLFRGHMQPRLPADLGFYDLRLPEARMAQADLARDYGIEGFCYWHYWFAGRRLLERPFNDVLASGEPDFPFCLAWANHSWSAAWIGLPNKVFFEQTYPGIEDYTNHFYAVLPALTDPRYLRVDGKPIFVVFRPTLIPEPREFADLWRKLADKEGLPGLHIVGVGCVPWNLSHWMPADVGFDALITTPVQSPKSQVSEKQMSSRKSLRQRVRALIPGPQVTDYSKAMVNVFRPSPLPPYVYPAALSNWDCTPRYGKRGPVLNNCTPATFRTHLRDAIDHIAERDFQNRLVFIKSWNEWAEGNYLEPDQQFGHGFLEVVREEVCRCRAT